MTTFPAGEQTHQAVLPQQPALESVGADTPGSRDETAHGHPAAARGTGREHGRGETGGQSTRARRRHAGSATPVARAAENGSGDAPPDHGPADRGGVGVSRVFVLSKEGRPLKWGNACAYCEATGVPLNIDHLHPRSRGGSHRVSNLVLACVPCNQAKGNASAETFLAHRPDRLATILRQVSPSLQDAAAMNTILRQLVDALGGLGRPVHSWPGAMTKENRSTAGLAKTHTLDALCVGRLDHEAGDAIVRYPRPGPRRPGGRTRLLRSYDAGSPRISPAAARPRQAAFRIRHRGSRPRRHPLGQVGGHVDRACLRPSQGPAQPDHTGRPDQRLSPQPPAAATRRRLRLHHASRATAIELLGKTA
ncbi:HNH endonuclease [Streptomyces pharetrae]|uniref:HNH endonuclease n=1 Tax=Streptomyces pharetrae TaxID=291370 RepID=UPI00335B4079